MSAFDPQYKYYGVPSVGMQPRDILSDESLIRDLVVRSRIEYYAAECASGDKGGMEFGRMANHYAMTLSCPNSHPPVALQDLLAEVSHRAEGGSPVAKKFMSAAKKFQRTDRRHRHLHWPQWTQNEIAITSVIHDLINNGGFSTPLLRSLNSNHSEENLAIPALPEPTYPHTHAHRDSKPKRPATPKIKTPPKKRRALTLS